MRTHRKERLSDLIAQYLSEIMLRELDIEPGTLATISEVNVGEDLHRAVVHVSVLPSEKGKEVMEYIVKRAPHLQFLLGRKLNIRPMPELHFELDKGLENAAKVEKKLLEG